MTKRQAGEPLPDARDPVLTVREKDPCPDIPAALLSSEHIKEYFEKTNMIKEFYPERVKSASYEMNAARIIRWDDKENLIVNEKKRRKRSYPLSSQLHCFRASRRIFLSPVLYRS